MFKSYLKIAFRNLWKNRGFSAINIFGLATGLTACLLILFYVIDETGYDKYNTKADRICRIDIDIKFGDNHFVSAQTAAIMAPVFAREYAQIEAYTRLRENGSLQVKKGAEIVRENKVLYADSTLFDVFTLPMIEGNPKTALREPHSLVITESMAKKYFNKTNAVGLTLVINDTTPYKITGVIKDIPVQSHFTADFLLPMAEMNYSRNGSWFANNYNTYIVLKKDVTAAQMAPKFNKTMEAYAAPQLKEMINQSMDDLRKGGGYMNCSLMPLASIHLHSNKEGELGSNGSIQYVYIFSATALFILLIACINFMNLSTARSSNRAKEVGVRKVLGSLRKNLVAQFLTESFLISLFALVLSILLTWLLIPYFNTLTQKHIGIQVLFQPLIFSAVLLLMISMGLLAGSYPAFVLSGFNPVDVLKGSLSKGFKSSRLRNGLVIFQFAVSIVLIIGTIVIYNQLLYIRNKDLGFSKEQILVIRNTEPLGEQATHFKNELASISGVANVTMTGYLPVNGYRNSNATFTEPTMDINKAISMETWGIDEQYIPTLGMKILQGRNFSKAFPSDSTAVIINETALKFLGPGDPVNKKLYSLDDPATKKIVSYRVIGVVKNFNFNSLREQVTPLALFLNPNRGGIAIRVMAKNIPALLSQVESKYKALAPGQPFTYMFMDDLFNKQYLAEQRTGKISITFSIVAILIACLGLFGLVTYAATQRTREIGIRKVLGASVPNIVNMLCKDFLKLVAVAACIAFPLAWWMMNGWLQNFAYRIGISWWVFLMAGIIALLIAITTVSFQAIRAALANPVKSLRAE